MLHQNTLKATLVSKKLYAIFIILSSAANFYKKYNLSKGVLQAK